MIDFDKQLVSALKTVLPTHHELALTANISVPCISYQERDNADTTTGDTLGYSRVSYTVKVWGNEIKQIKHYAKQIDTVLRSLGFNRVSTGELYDRQSTMIQKILTFEAQCFEKYK